MPISIKQSVAQQIVEAVKDVCAHDINYINTRGIIFASTNKKRIGDFHEIGKQVATTGETIEVEMDGSFLGTKKGVNMPFLYKGELCAVIGISGNPSEVRKYAFLAQKITTLILREHELDRNEQLQRTQLNQIVRSLVSGEYINPQYLDKTLKKYDANFSSNYRTVIVKLDARYNPSNLSMIEKNIYKAFESVESRLYTFNYSNEYIAFVEDKNQASMEYYFRTLGEANSPLLKIGIGYSLPITKQAQSYQTAQIAVQSLLGSDSFAVFEQLDLEILLGDISKEAKQFFLSKTLQSLTEKDRKILSTYFSNQMSLKKTCEELYLHKNTLQYQLDRISRITGYNPREFKDAVVLYVGLKLGVES